MIFSTDKRRSRQGSAMVMILFILAILTLVGLLVIKSTTMELKMAANQWRHREAFYAAEGVAELVSEILEQNIACPEGFSDTGRFGEIVQVTTPDFWKNEPVSTWLDEDNIEAEASLRDLRIPAATEDDEPHCDVFIGGAPAISAGNALQTAAGYDGIGRSAAEHGTHLIYDQIIRHAGRFQTEAVLRIRWRHVVGTEGPCNP